MQGMPSVSGERVSVNGSVALLISLALGTVAGELIGIEDRVNRLGEKLERKVKPGEGTGLAEGFVKAAKELMTAFRGGLLIYKRKL